MLYTTPLVFPTNDKLTWEDVEKTMRAIQEVNRRACIDLPRPLPTRQPLPKARVIKRPSWANWW